MNLKQWISATFHGRSQPRPVPRIKIANLTRQSLLASCADTAKDGASRRTGLLKHKSLPAGEGLWIVPCESVHTFFMKFPIDLVYIDRNKKVKKVRSNVSPWRLSACLSAHSIIELPAGAVRGSQTVPGDQLEFSPADAPDEACHYPVTD